nr:immunoglobulin light chain junction region [Macaca mulatta]MOW42537.1 immunoglobulin light chain junction region [Macaca mulatta]
CQQNSKWPYSF